jgi:GT2 family glycosyltransferase
MTVTADPVVAICVPIYDRPATDFFWAYQQMLKPNSGSEAFGGRGATHFFSTRGILVEEARNQMTLQALDEPDVTHVLMLDCDMVPPPHALKRLLEHDVPIVGGLCHNRRPPYQPIVCRWYQESLALGVKRHGFCYHFPPDVLFPVDATGAAFLLIKREVLEAIEKREGKKWWEKRDGLSEDFSMCVRAQEAGFPIVVDTGLEIGHVGEVLITKEFADKNRPYEWGAWNPEPHYVPGQPVASIVIPVYNQNPRYLRAAVYSAAHQTVPVEVIVVDDGSDVPIPTEGWPQNVRVLRVAENLGIANALNYGLKSMVTDWFMWLSSDDFFDPRKVQLQLAALEQARCKAGFTRWQGIVPGEHLCRIASVPGWRSLAEQQALLGQACVVNGSTVAIHKSVIAEVGAFDTRYKYGQDWEMWCRVGRTHFWYGLGEILVTRREHDNLTAAIAAEPPDSPRRRRRDEEDALIRETYGVGVQSVA